MMKFGSRMRILDSLPHAKFCKNRLTGYNPFVQIYTKNCHFWLFIGAQDHIYKATTVQIAVKVRTWEFSLRQIL